MSSGSHKWKAVVNSCTFNHMNKLKRFIYFPLPTFNQLDMGLELIPSCYEAAFLTTTPPMPFKFI